MCVYYLRVVVCTCIMCCVVCVCIMCINVYVFYEYECVYIICVFVNTYYMYTLLCNIDIFVIYNTCILICIIYTHAFSKIITYIRLSDYVLFTHDIYVLCTSYAGICYICIISYIICMYDAMYYKYNDMYYMYVRRYVL